jgi:hypothetical protein
VLGIYLTFSTKVVHGTVLYIAKDQCGSRPYSA